MEHIKRITVTKPAPANLGGNIICKTAITVNDFLSFVGGQEPLLEYIQDKCAVPPGYFD